MICPALCVPRRVVFILGIVLLMIHTAYAVDSTWDKGNDGTNGNYIWTDANNWIGGVPGITDRAVFVRKSWGKPIAIDMKGSSYQVDQIMGSYNGDYIAFYDSDFLTPNSNPLGSNSAGITNFSYSSTYSSFNEVANASPMLRLNTLSLNKQSIHTYYLPITVGTLNTNGTEFNMYGDVTITGSANLTERSGQNDHLTFYGNVSAPLFTVGGGENGTDLIATVHGNATIGTLTSIQGAARFNNLKVDNKVILGNRNSLPASVEISGRYSGVATYEADSTLTTNAINLQAGSTLAPGNSVGTLGSTALTVNMSGANYEWEIADPASTPGAGWDLSLAGTFNIDGPMNFQIAPLGLTENISASKEFAILGALPSGFDLTDINLASDVNFSILGDPTGWDLSGASLALITDYADLDGIAGNEDALVLSGIIARFGGSGVPEPMSLAVWSLLGVGLFFFGRRRRKA